MGNKSFMLLIVKVFR